MTWNAHRNAPAPGTVLCRRDEVPDGGVREFTRGEGRDAFRFVLVRWGGECRAYVNRCPHFLIPLNTGDGGFLTTAGVLWCGQHSAQFRFEDGFCVDGPCKGGTLEAIPLSCRDGVLAIA
ncbi:MAG: Rieske 2Fe-2S domain-containing protein [Hyphomicrobiales bacterium]